MCACVCVCLYFFLCASVHALSCALVHYTRVSRRSDDNIKITLEREQGKGNTSGNRKSQHGIYIFLQRHRAQERFMSANERTWQRADPRRRNTNQTLIWFLKATVIQRDNTGNCTGSFSPARGEININRPPIELRNFWLWRLTVNEIMTQVKTLITAMHVALYSPLNQR